jgi:dienelactone hydrolase
MLNAPMRATRDAPAAPPRGRLIVSQLTPITTANTHEVLASHGFVVAAVQYRPVDGNSGTPLEREGRTTEVFRQDLGLAIDRMRQEPYVAPGPLGTFAFSGAGVPVVALAAANRDVGAMALFETGWHGSLGSSFGAVRDFSFSQIRSPFLFVVGAGLDHADVQMKDIDAMSQSARTMARTGAPGLSHWDFAAEGYLAAADPHWRAADRGAVRAIFEEANTLAVAFFDQHLRSGPSTVPATPHFRLRSIAAGSSESVAPRVDASAIAGMWKGTVTAGAQSSDIGIEIRQLANGTGFFLTLPPLHAWRMPVS